MASSRGRCYHWRSPPDVHRPRNRACSPGNFPYRRSACRCSRRTSSRPRSRSPRRPGLAMLAQRRQRRRRGARRRDHAHRGRAHLERHRLGRLRDPLGRPAPGRPQRLGPLARGLDARALRRARRRCRTLGWDAVTVPGASRPGSRSRSATASCPSRTSSSTRIKYARESYMVSPITAISWARPGGRTSSTSPNSAGPSCPRTARPIRASASIARSRPRRSRRSPSTQGRELLPRRARRAHRARRRADGGAMTMEDLAAHKADWVEPISIEYRGYQLHEIPPNGPGHRRADGARHAAPPRPRRRCRSIRPTACTCRSRR